MWAVDLDDFNGQCGGENNPLLGAITKELGMAGLTHQQTGQIPVNTISDNTVQGVSYNWSPVAKPASIPLPKKTNPVPQPAFPKKTNPVPQPALPVNNQFPLYRQPILQSSHVYIPPQAKVQPVSNVHDAPATVQQLRPNNRIQFPRIQNVQTKKPPQILTSPSQPAQPPVVPQHKTSQPIIRHMPSQRPPYQSGPRTQLGPTHVLLNPTQMSNVGRYEIPISPMIPHGMDIVPYSSGEGFNGPWNGDVAFQSSSEGNMVLGDDMFLQAFKDFLDGLDIGS